MWNYWAEVKKGERLTYTELQCWSQMTSTPLSATEVEIIMKIDAAFSSELQSG